MDSIKLSIYIQCFGQFWEYYPKTFVVIKINIFTWCVQYWLHILRKNYYNLSNNIVMFIKPKKIFSDRPSHSGHNTIILTRVLISCSQWERKSIWIRQPFRNIPLFCQKLIHSIRQLVGMTKDMDNYDPSGVVF